MLSEWLLRKLRNACGAQVVIDALTQYVDERLAATADRLVAQLPTYGREWEAAVRADVSTVIHGHARELFTALRCELAGTQSRCEERFEVTRTEVIAQIAQLRRMIEHEYDESRSLLDSVHSKCGDLLERGSAGLDVPMLVALCGSELRFCLGKAGNPIISAKRGSAPRPIVVCSIPKAGTYLIGKLLALLGQEDLHLHVWDEGLSDYRDKTIEQMRREYSEFTVPIPLRTVARMVQPGQFIVGHIQYSEQSVVDLGPFASLFAVRDMRDAVVSHMRFFADTGRGGAETSTWSGLPDGPEKMLRYMSHVGPSYFALCRAVLPWSCRAEVLQVRFETLLGDQGPAAQVDLLSGICRQIGIAPDAFDLAEVCRKALGSATKTWSGRRSVRTLYWNNAVEQRFQELGGDEINMALGYGEADCAARDSDDLPL